MQNAAGIVVRRGQSSRLSTILQVLLLIGIGIAATFAKKLQPSLGIPGSSAPFWLGIMVAGRALVCRDGAGALIGTTVAISGIPVGLNNTFLHNLGLYGFTGLALDLVARLPGINVTKPLGAVACGVLAHLVKFGFITGIAYASPVTKHFLVIGLGQSALLHIVFGAAAGVVGWGITRSTTYRLPPVSLHPPQALPN